MIFLASVPEAEEGGGDEITSTKDDNVYRVEAEKGEHGEEGPATEGEDITTEEEEEEIQQDGGEEEEEQREARPVRRRGRGRRGGGTMASSTGESSSKSIRNLERRMEKQIKSTDKQAGQLKQLQSDVRQMQKQLSNVERSLQRILKKGTGGRARK